MRYPTTRETGLGVPFVKVLSENNYAPFTGYRWNVPEGDGKPAKKMRRIPGRLEMCDTGYHVTDVDHHVIWSTSLLDRVWYVEVDIPIEGYSTGNKYLVRGARILSEVPDDKLNAAFAAARQSLRDSLIWIPDIVGDGSQFTKDISCPYVRDKVNDRIFANENANFAYELRDALNSPNTFVTTDYVGAVINGTKAISKQYLCAALTFVVNARIKQSVGKMKGRLRDNKVADKVIVSLQDGRIPVGYNNATLELEFRES